MIGELLNSAENRMKDLLKRLDNGEEFKINILESFKNLRSNQFMANLLAHDNPLIEELSNSEIERFCNGVHSLYETFLCANCNGFLKYEKNYNEIRCANIKCSDPIIIKL